ncbi:hypothetical protein AC22_2271 [Escherichia coli 5-366-08_S3_C2]|nr:hypothetical protein AC22_2271 [Escherichia coli 5-366-08_S3_C2]
MNPSILRLCNLIKKTFKNKTPYKKNSKQSAKIEKLLKIIYLIYQHK